MNLPDNKLNTLPLVHSNGLVDVYASPFVIAAYVHELPALELHAGSCWHIPSEDVSIAVIARAATVLCQYLTDQEHVRRNTVSIETIDALQE